MEAYLLPVIGALLSVLTVLIAFIGKRLFGSLDGLTDEFHDLKLTVTKMRVALGMEE